MELDRKRNYEKFTTFVSDCDEMIIGNHLRLFSICEHHLLPFYGEVAIGYIPDGKIFGLSKFQRLVDMLASKPQIQETLTVKILEEIKNRLNPAGIGVVVKAIHTCVLLEEYSRTKQNLPQMLCTGNSKKNLKLEANFFHVCEHTMLVIHSIKSMWHSRNNLRSQ
jgi:GTP cyclohydrolase IA